MNALLMLVPLALALGLAGLAGFMWCMRSDQYEDLEGASLRVLNDDDLPPASQAEQR
ncbi:cbb3-type cytochrome oxidase assembly protein CcoS [Pseudochelatococcus sp. G4_1912]|uniref:cbb3-type cytochrome oxidase assembly protein CcoS n=1 Tax=Pseudochelatococcus sp. G4_1912 TaxID=3114288 RepID=UPI0039C6747D